MTHPDPTPVDPADRHRVSEEVVRRSTDRQLPCAVAFDIANALDIAPAAVGTAADRMKIRLIKCQLGLFGYQPRKKIVQPATDVSEDLREAIAARCIDGRVSCEALWQVAAEQAIGKMAAAGACETLGIKIKPCQLGAF